MTDRIPWAGVLIGGAYVYVLDQLTWPPAAPLLCLAMVVVGVGTARWLDRQDPYPIKPGRPS